MPIEGTHKTINGRPIPYVIPVDENGEPAGGGTSPIEQPLTDDQLRASAVPVSGPLTNAQLVAVTGTAAQTTVADDPAAEGLTVVSLLRGILAEQQAQTALLQTIADNTAP